MSTAAYVLDKDGFIGPFFTGCFISTWLSGIIWAQAATYNKLWPKGKDRDWIRWSVIALLGLDLITTVCACVSPYLMGVTGWGNLEAVITKAPWSFAVNPICAGLTAFIVQIFFGFRVYHVSGKSFLIPVVILLLGLVQLGFSIGATFACFAWTFAELVPKYNWGVSAWLASACGADFIIAAAIVYYLSRAKATSTFADTNSLLTKVMWATLETNAATALVALIDAVLFSALTTTNYHIITNLVLVKLYMISFFFSLTSRPKLNRAEPATHQLAVRKQAAHNGSEDDWNRNRDSEGKGGRTPLPIVVTMDIERHEEVEEEKEAWGGRQPTRAARTAQALMDAQV